MISERDLLSLVLARPAVSLFLDYDGTLAEFAPTPEHIEPDREVVELLTRMTASPRISPTILSGRSLAAVEALMPVEGMTLAGSYGVELRTSDGERIERLRREEVRPFLETLIPMWREVFGGAPGFFLEDKGWSVAIHARLARAEDADRVLTSARDLAEAVGIPAGFRLLEDDRFLEAAPRAANKRDGVEFLLRQRGISALSLYFGDDDKDIEAFDAIHRDGGLTVLVGDRYPAETSGADCSLPDPGSVRAWLRLMLESM